MRHFCVYILKCADGSYYVGSHRGADVMHRVHEHNLGENRRAYTFRRRPVECVWSDWFSRAEDMVAVERQLKGWSRAKKEALIRGDVRALKAASVSKSAPAVPRRNEHSTHAEPSRSKKAGGIAPNASSFDFAQDEGNTRCNK